MGDADDSVDIADIDVKYVRKLHPVSQGERDSDSEENQILITRVTFRLCLTVLAAVMGSLVFGYNTGVINAPEKAIEEFTNETYVNRGNHGLTVDETKRIFAVIVAIFAVGGMIGGLLAGWWADFFGRKRGMMINTVFGVTAAALMFFSKMAGSYEMLIVGRLLVGFSCGVYTGLTPMYLSEIASPNTRGALGVLHQLGVTFGIFISQILGFPELLGNEGGWHILFGLTALPCILQLLISPFCPETPRYLLLKKDDEAGARAALELFRGTDDIENDIREMEAENIASKSVTKVGFLDLLKSSSLRMPLLISVVMQLSQQLSGINAIFYYSTDVFTTAGLSPTEASYATSGVGAVMVVMTLITIPLIDRMGRRTLHLTGLGGMFVFSILITITLTFKESIHWFKICSIIVSLLYVGFFALGPGSIPWLIVSELFSQGPRPSAMSIAVLINWLSNFAVGYGYKQMQIAIGELSFIPFTVLLALFWLFTLKFLPETKNKTIDEISAIFRKKSDSVALSNGYDLASK